MHTFNNLLVSTIQFHKEWHSWKWIGRHHSSTILTEVKTKTKTRLLSSWPSLHLSFRNPLCLLLITHKMQQWLFHPHHLYCHCHITLLQPPLHRLHVKSSCWTSRPWWLEPSLLSMFISYFCKNAGTTSQRFWRYEKVLGHTQSHVAILSYKTTFWPRSGTRTY